MTRSTINASDFFVDNPAALFTERSHRLRMDLRFAVDFASELRPGPTMYLDEERPPLQSALEVSRVAAARRSWWRLAEAYG